MPRIYRKGAKLLKTLIYLDETVHRRLKYLALDERLSMAEIIRRAVDEHLKRQYGGRRKRGGGSNA